MSGTSDKIKGRVKEAVGALTDDQRLKDEGRLDQTTGKIKKTVERVIDKANKTGSIYLTQFERDPPEPSEIERDGGPERTTPDEGGLTAHLSQI
jgi:uncharacterized protein YjbJ (UPF0337 family)